MKTTIQTALFTAAFTATTLNAAAQSISINQRSHLVMNGNVQLVVNNAAFNNNNGNFSAATGTVVLSGNADTATSYVGGTSASTFYNLTVNKSSNGSKLKSTSNVRNTLTVSSGTLFADSNLVLKSDAALTARVAPVLSGAAISGKAHVERYIPSRRAWRLMTAPVTQSNSIFSTWQNNGVYVAGRGTFVTGPNPSNANGLDASPQNNISLKTWNNTTQQFVNITNTYAAISAGTTGSADNTGYFMFVRGDRNTDNFSTNNSNTTTLTATGKLQTGNQVFTASSASGAVSLVGNPYASPVDFGALNRSNLMNRFYVWDPYLNSVGGYVMLDDLSNTGTYTKSVSASNQTRYIQSGQAFFVQTNAAGAASITFTENNKTSDNNTQAFRPSNGTTSSTPSSMFRINLYQTENNEPSIIADGTFAEFNSQFSNGIDLDDAPKFTNINENIALYRNNNTLSAERRSDVYTTDTLFIRMWKTTQRVYAFQFDPSNMGAVSAKLYDKYLNTYMDLNTSMVSWHEFTIDANAASMDQYRFMIIFRQSMLLPVSFTSVSALHESNAVKVNWQVANQTNISGYQVEFSTNGTQFNQAGSSIAAVNMNQADYSFNHKVYVTGTIYYRIKAMNNDGSYQYSAIVRVQAKGNNKGSMQVYPNPVQDQIIHLQMNNQATGNYQFRVVSQQGQVIVSKQMQNSSSNSTIDISLPSTTASGIYQLEITSPNQEQTSKTVYIR